MKKQIITLTTDWGTKDYYVGSVKAKLLSSLEDSIEIVDVSHHINPLNIQEAAFVLKNCMDFFPKNSIHIIGVKSEASPQTPHLAVLYKDSWFISADNGIFTLLFTEKPEKIIEIDVIQDSDYYTFPTRDVFVKVASMLVNNTDFSKIGTEVPDFKNYMNFFEPSFSNNIISGIVCHLDNYGNIITNITAEFFKKHTKSKEFSIIFAGSYELNDILSSYSDVGRGELVAVFNTTGNLEIAINDGRASDLFGVKCNDPVRVIIK